MRTRPARIEPGCVYCNHDHNPDIPCRHAPESVRFQIAEQTPTTAIRKIERITDASGKLIAVKEVYR